MEEGRNTLHVLVSEDDPDDQFLFRSALEQMSVPVDVTFVLTGNQLIQHLLRSVLSKNQDGLHLPDLIIADLRRPFFWLEVVRELRIYKQFSHIPVYLFSMRANQQLHQSALWQGATALYEKPHTFHELKKIVREIVRAAITH